MAKAKTNWRHLHKIKIHDNRWLVWTIAIAVLLCAAVVAYIEVSGIYFDTQMNTTYGSPSTWSTFNNVEQGYSLRYPRAWAVEADGDESMSFVSLKNANEYFGVTTYPAAQEKSVTNGLFTTQVNPVIVSGIQGVKFSQKTSQAENVVVIKQGDVLYVLRGRTPAFDKIASTFKLNQVIE